MENTRKWKFGNWRMAVWCSHIWKTRRRGCYSDGAVHTGQRTWKHARPPLWIVMDKGWDCTAKKKKRTHPPEIASFHLRNSSFRAFSRWQHTPLYGQPGGACIRWKRAVSLCLEACTPLSRCADDLWNSCFVEIMKFFGPWFYERQYFHNPVNMGISKWLQAGTNGTGTN